MYKIQDAGDWLSFLQERAMEENEKRLIEETHKLMGEEKGNAFLKTFGMGPTYKSKPRKTVLCPNCLKQNAYYREDHPDTDMNEINLYCPDCGYNTA